LIKVDHCNICKRALSHKEKVAVLLIDIEVSTKDCNADARLKLSVDAIENRAIKIICKKCINITEYLKEE